MNNSQALKDVANGESISQLNSSNVLEQYSCTQLGIIKLEDTVFGKKSSQTLLLIAHFSGQPSLKPFANRESGLFEIYIWESIVNDCNNCLPWRSIYG